MADNTTTNVIAATFVAMNPALNQTTFPLCVHHGSGASVPAAVLPSGSPTRWGCYILEMTNTNAYEYGTTYSSFQSFNDYAEITWNNQGVNAGINCTGMVCRGNASLTCHGNSEAYAACIPITTYLGSVSAGATWESTSTNLGGVDWTNGKMCALTAVGGAFVYNAGAITLSNQQNQNLAGVYTYNDGTNWYFNTYNNMRGAVDCME